MTDLRLCQLGRTRVYLWPQHRPAINGDGNTECWAAMVSPGLSAERKESMEKIGEGQHIRVCVCGHRHDDTEIWNVARYLHLTSIDSYKSR